MDFFCWHEKKISLYYSFKQKIYEKLSFHSQFNYDNIVFVPKLHEPIYSSKWDGVDLIFDVVTSLIEFFTLLSA